MTDIACWVQRRIHGRTTLPRSGSSRASFEVGGWVPLRTSYRLELMAPGQRRLLGLSGPDELGIYAIGEHTGVVDDNSRGAGRYWRDLVKMRRLAPEVPIKVVPLSTPVLRVDLMQEAKFRKAEFIRMAAGSNPSYLDPNQSEVVEGHLQAADVTAAGW